MPSLVSRWRPLSESLLRLVAVGLLVWSLLGVLRQRAAGGPEERAGSRELLASLGRWSTVASPRAVRVDLGYPPSLIERDWLSALPGAGTRMKWSGSALVPSALALLPVADPAGGFDLAVAAPDGSSVIVGDSLGREDTLKSLGAGVRVHLPGSSPDVAVRVGSIASRAVVRDSLRRGRLLLLGAAGWEAKFVTAALEERGWTVDAHLAVAPGGDVSQGTPAGTGNATAPVAPPLGPPPPQVSSVVPGFRSGRGVQASPLLLAIPERAEPASQTSLRIPIDTGRYSAVIALDSTAAREALRIARFVRSGGGLVLWPEAAAHPALRDLAPARPDDLVGEPGRKIVRPLRAESLAVRPLVSLHADAVVLERVGSHVTLAGRRIGLGRVVETGYVEFWRLRLAGDQSSVERHRNWLARVVAGVAFTRREPLTTLPGDAAPLAALIDRLGPPEDAPSLSAALAADPLSPWIIGVIAAALLLEWLSRRLRSRP